MSDRERWIIYPLLFMALGVALRDKIIKTTASQRIQSESLLVADSTGNTIAVLGHERFDRSMTAGKDLLSVDVIRAGQIEFVDDKGTVVSTLASVPAIVDGRRQVVTRLDSRLVVDQMETSEADINILRSRISHSDLAIASDYRRVVDGQVVSLLYLLDAGAPASETIPTASDPKQNAPATSPDSQGNAPMPSAEKETEPPNE